MKREIVPVLILASVAWVFLSCTPRTENVADEVLSRRESRAEQHIEIAHPDWSSEVASARLIQAVLQERLGYRVSLRQTDVEGMWRLPAAGEADLMTGAWLPHTHTEYHRRYVDQLEDLGPHMVGARIGLVVPVQTPGRQTDASGSAGRDLVTLRSIEELGDHSTQFDGRIIGIESGAGVMARTREALESYGLDRRFRIIEGTEASMVREVENAIRAGKWVVFTGWTPHWIFERYALRFLDDPLGVFGGEETVNTMARSGFSDTFPDAAAVLKRMQWKPQEMERLMNWIEEDTTGDAYGQAVRWIRTNSDTVDTWVAGIE